VPGHHSLTAYEPGGSGRQSIVCYFVLFYGTESRFLYLTGQVKGAYMPENRYHARQAAAALLKMAKSTKDIITEQ
jgi:hypothetical protein